MEAASADDLFLRQALPRRVSAPEVAVHRAEIGQDYATCRSEGPGKPQKYLWVVSFHTGRCVNKTGSTSGQAVCTYNEGIVGGGGGSVGGVVVGTVTGGATVVGGVVVFVAPSPESP